MHHLYAAAAAPLMCTFLFSTCLAPARFRCMVEKYALSAERMVGVYERVAARECVADNDVNEQYGQLVEVKVQLGQLIQLTTAEMHAAMVTYAERKGEAHADKLVHSGAAARRSIRLLAAASKRQRVV